MRRAFDVLRILADGRAYSGRELADRLGVTRAAVWNQIQRLRKEGVEIAGAAGHGYQLVGGYEFLDGELLLNELRARERANIARIDVHDVTTSTNQLLLEASAKGDIHQHLVFADYQSAGRGRRGDRWLSAPGSGLCFSLGWRFDTPPATFSALSLVVGVALIAALEKHGIDDVRLKWPNDLVRGPAKLAGILIEMRSEAGGPCVTVIGIGLNIFMSEFARSLIDRPVEDLSQVSGQRLSRQAVAQNVVAALARELENFSQSGFGAYRDRWLALDALANKEVAINLGPRIVRGVARGVDEHGAILIEREGRRERFMAGHIVEFGT